MNIAIIAAAASQNASTTTAPDLPNPTRLISTTNLDTGISEFNTSLPEELTVVRNLNGALFRLGYITNVPPISLANQNDISTYASDLQDLPPLVPDGGGPIVWYIDTPPDSASPLHRTVSVDIVVQLQGTIELTLEDGTTKLQKTGDLTINRAVLHAWRNPSKTEWSRMLGVMMQSEPVTLNNGTTLGAYFPSSKH